MRTGGALPTAASRLAWFVAVKVVAVVAATGTLSGCERPYPGPKTLASIGVGVLAGSAALWVAGDRNNSRTLSRMGAAGVAAGAGAAVASGAWLAGQAGCRVDPDCPDDEVCREIPAPPGREPFRQCSPR
jgi:hypothetical protein